MPGIFRHFAKCLITQFNSHYFIQFFSSSQVNSVVVGSNPGEDNVGCTMSLSCYVLLKRNQGPALSFVVR